MMRAACGCFTDSVAASIVGQHLEANCIVFVCLPQILKELFAVN